MLDELRSQGVIRAVGAGMNQWQVLADFARAGDFDCFLLAGRYTLLEQTSLAGLLTLCEEKGVRIVIGGPYNSGILATGGRRGGVLQLRSRPAPRPRPGLGDRGGLRAPRGAPAGRGPAVPAGPPGRRLRHPRRPHPRRARGQRLPARGGDPGRVLVRAQGAGPRRPGLAAALVSPGGRRPETAPVTAAGAGCRAGGSRGPLPDAGPPRNTRTRSRAGRARFAAAEGNPDPARAAGGLGEPTRCRGEISLSFQPPDRAARTSPHPIRENPP